MLISTGLSRGSSSSSTSNINNVINNNNGDSGSISNAAANNNNKINNLGGIGADTVRLKEPKMNSLASFSHNVNCNASGVAT